MEFIVIAIAVVVVGYLVFRPKKVAEVVEAAPYKIETVEAVAPAPVAEAAPAKPARKPRATKAAAKPAKAAKPAAKKTAGRKPKAK